MARHSTPNTKSGFTILELSLATAFVSVLLLMITAITINMSTIYQKGLTLRSVNQNGRDLIDDFTRSIGAAPIEKFNESERWRYFNERTGEVEDKIKQFGGAFCTGKYSYVWNTGNIPDGTSKISITWSGGELPAPRLVRFPDIPHAACVDPDDSKKQRNFNNNPVINIPTLSEAPQELLANSEMELVPYELAVFISQDSSTYQTIYSGTFILGTSRGGIDILATGNYCNIQNDNPASLSGDFNYCAVNKFNFTARATDGQSQRSQ